jgi:hypothetical protein
MSAIGWPSLDVIIVNTFDTAPRCYRGPGWKQRLDAPSASARLSTAHFATGQNFLPDSRWFEPSDRSTSRRCPPVCDGTTESPVARGACCACSRALLTSRCRPRHRLSAICAQVIASQSRPTYSTQLLSPMALSKWTSSCLNRRTRTTDPFGRPGVRRPEDLHLFSS